MPPAVVLGAVVAVGGPVVEVVEDAGGVKLAMNGVCRTVGRTTGMSSTVSDTEGVPNWRVVTPVAEIT